jgi:uncharacterized lipoprotein YddW (UPF0748 family)
MPKNAAAATCAALGVLILGSALHPMKALGEAPLPFPAEAARPTPPANTLDLTLPTDAAAPPAFPAVPATPAAAGEIRAMWVVRDAMTSPERIRNTVALAKKHRFNTLFVQVRGRGDAFYDSRFEPRAEVLSGQPLSFDPLALIVDEGHRAGLQVHAWLNTFFVWHQKRRPYSALHVVNRHPEWLVRDKQNRWALTERKDCEGAFLDPSFPGVREHTRDVFLDVATRYAVDGIHFDYVRFPNEDYSFSDEALARFRESLLPTLTPEAARFADARRAAGSRLAWYHLHRAEWRAWRRGLVTQTVREIADAARALRPGLIVSAAVFPDYSVASDDKGQAWREWLQAGILDAACPMTYNRSTPLVARQIRDAVAAAGGRPIIAGVGAWQMPAASSIAKVRAYRAVGASGMNFFSYNGMTREGRTDAYLAKLTRELFPTPVATPNWRRPVETARRGAGNLPGGG